MSPCRAQQQTQVNLRQTDRRRFSHKTLIWHFHGGRREQARRLRDRDEGYYVDRYNRRAGWLALGIVLLSMVDAHATLVLLSGGAEELNPFMHYLIEWDSLSFFFTKVAITTGCVLFILMHENFRLFRWLRGRNLIYLILLAYGSLVFYQVTLLRDLWSI